ncbi:hypothetical protein CEB94_30800 [Streptomyces hawaiiensis]|uniref:SDR family oxidoreductase n=1 Tax=Streptomyces hawaiiensis TaxID=67305 RepID=A0A6G5RSU5_9ACTN|nr:hypothetical protein CEB94_30800 [Streptomyces hawaiiensis]
MPAITPQPRSPATCGATAGSTLVHCPAATRVFSANLGRRSTPEEQAAVLVFLASDAAEMINGAVLPVDDGWSAV